MKFTIYDLLTGRVLFGGTSDDPGVLLQPGQAMLEGEEFTDGWMADGMHFAMPDRPDPHHVFDYSLKVWRDPRTLQDLKDAHWQKIKQARQAQELAGFEWDGSHFDSDAISQQRIAGAVQIAQLLGAAFSIDWTLANNTARTLDAAQMIQVGLSLSQHVNAIHQVARGLRAAIDAATSAEQLDAVIWPVA